jgi:RNA polymerase sigma factor (sigma-70 family)
MAEALEQLLTQLNSGQAEAAAEVFRTFEPCLRAVVRRSLSPRLRAKFDSADVVQSVWADLLGRFRDAGCRFVDADHLRAFLLRTTRHRFIDRLRHCRTAAARERPLAPSADGVAAPGPRPSECAQAEEVWQKLLALCPPDHRDVLRLRRQGLTRAEIAARTGLHEGSVRRLLRTLARRLAFAGCG